METQPKLNKIFISRLGYHMNVLSTFSLAFLSISKLLFKVSCLSQMQHAISLYLTLLNENELPRKTKYIVMSEVHDTRKKNPESTTESVLRLNFFYFFIFFFSIRAFFHEH